ncbi:Signal transduction histidine kinase [Aureimonas jatrophae]|uniref:histidine kinase n=1 Tax=Aureimonas jatrophae TaxID=1166073 RepID=A0A1H0KAG6_9HYPH|nr:Signal transduction histidine kinase [Aureimonas jatrophae]
MNVVLKRLYPSTLRGQIILMILVAVISVIVVGRIIEPLRETGPLASADLDLMVDRVSLIAQVMARSDEAERSWLLERFAVTGLELRVVDRPALATMRAMSADGYAFERWVFWLFPPDAYPASGGGWDIVDGRPFFWCPIDGSTFLVARNLPSMVSTTDFSGPLTYYLLAFATLLVLFTVYAAQALANPLARIVDELDRSDGVSKDTPIAERGTVEIVRLAKALNGMRTRIRSMVDMRMRMLRSVSHDLRTPLTRLRLRAERLDDVTTRQSMLGDIEQIDALIGETLAYLRTDALGEEAEKLDVASLLQTIQCEFADVGFPVRYEGPDRLSAVCRPNALTRAVNNLCDNALKFGQEAVVSLVPNGSEYWIEVADDGPGIPADKRELVLEPFYKLDASRGPNSPKGFGLGLSIVADIVRAHGGTLELHDRQPHGLVVRLRLPSLGNASPPNS